MTVVVGDCLDVLAAYRGDPFEAAILDLPSGANFMQLKFDLDHGGEDKWIAYFAERLAAVRQACIPGAYGLFWSLPRTSDWTMQACRRAGWHVTDKVSHFFGQGWPKGRGQLKPAREDWILCRDPRGKVRPLNIDACRVRRSWAERGESWFRSGNSAKPDAEKISGAPAGNGIHVHEGGSWPPHTLLSHCPACRQVGARKVRTDYAREPDGHRKQNVGNHPSRSLGRNYGFASGSETIPAFECLAACACGLASLAPAGGAPSPCPGCGGERDWQCPVAALDEQSGFLSTSGTAKAGKPTMGPRSWAAWEAGNRDTNVAKPNHADEGGASRFFPTFFYDAKSSRRERQAGCEHLLWIRDDSAPIGWRRVSAEEYGATPEKERRTGNTHATIKGIGCGDDDGLMRWLVRLVTPERGAVFDGTCGSGGTLIAAQIEGRPFYGCDIDPGAVDIALARLAFWTPERHRQVLADADALKAHERAVAREKATPRHDDLPLFRGAQ